MDINYFWYELTPRQGYNVAVGHGRLKKREFESSVFIERNLHCIILNAMAPKGKSYKPETYWPLDMDKEVKEKRKGRSSIARDAGAVDSTTFLNAFKNW